MQDCKITVSRRRITNISKKVKNIFFLMRSLKMNSSQYFKDGEAILFK